MYYIVHMYTYGIRTGEDIIIDARRVLTFKPSAVLKASLTPKNK